MNLKTNIKSMRFLIIFLYIGFFNFNLAYGFGYNLGALWQSQNPVAQQAYIKASNTGAGDYFGYAVAIDGSSLVVGAEREASNATGIGGDQTNNSVASSGAVYVFTRSGSTWSQQAYIKSSTNDGDRFGTSVSIDGDTLAVGAIWEDSNATGVNGDEANGSMPNSGAAYVFTRSGSTWTQQAYIKASNTNTQDRFGISVSVDGNTLAVGSTFEDSNSTGINGTETDNSALESGAVYVYTRSGTTWAQQAYIKASNTEAGDAFGFVLSLSGNSLAVGAYSEDSNATGINGTQADNSMNTSGAAYVFTRSGTTWTQQAYIKASNTGVTDRFAYSISIDGDSLAVGSYLEDSNAKGINGAEGNNSSNNSGAVYVFTRAGTTWTQQAYIKASNAEGADLFGWSVSIKGNKLAVGATQEDSSAVGVAGGEGVNSATSSGAVYAFKRVGTTWSQVSYVKALNTEASDYFGYAIAVSADSLSVGAYNEDSNDTGVGGAGSDNSLADSGSAYVYTWSD